MEFIIWGVTQLGRYLAKNLIHHGNKIRPFAFVDQNPHIQNTQVDGIQVISYEELLKISDSKKITVLIAMKNARNIFQVFMQTENGRFANIGVAKPQAMLEKASIDPWQESGWIIWKAFGEKTYRIIPRVEINLIDACNLKCRGCTHFASLFHGDSVYPLENYRDDLLRLKRIGTAARLRLLGGEPFLLGKLEEYLYFARDIFPEADIEIVTNGLLIPETREETLSAIKQCGISIAVSPYKPTLQIKNRIADRLNAYGIPWQLEGEEIQWFSRNLTLRGCHDPELSSAECLSAACLFLRKGRLHKCPVDGLKREFCGHYNLGLEPEGGISIYEDKDMVYQAIKDYALKPIDGCRYCAERPEFIPWTVKANPALEDWLYSEMAED